MAGPWSSSAELPLIRNSPDFSEELELPLFFGGEPGLEEAQEQEMDCQRDQESVAQAGAGRTDPHPVYCGIFADPLAFIRR